MKLTLSQAAKHTGLNKTTIARAIKKQGPTRLSANKLDDGTYAIDPAELDRWFHSNGHRNGKAARIATANDTPETPAQHEGLTARIELLEARLRDKEQVIEDLRDDRDQWRDQARQLLLTHSNGSPKEPAPAAPRPWWKRLVG